MAAQGMHRATGRVLTGTDHLYQSIRDILTTPIGTRVQRRDYGSKLFDLVDNPANEGLVIEIYAAIVAALARWEPRFRLEDIRLEKLSAQGHGVFALSGVVLANGEPVTLEGVVL